MTAERLPGDTRAERFRHAANLLAHATTLAEAERIVDRAAVTPGQRSTLLRDWVSMMEVNPPDKEEVAPIVCRSRKSKSCYNGRPVASVYPDGIEDDATFDGESVVCDACYIAIGQPSVPFGEPGAQDFPATIEGGRGRP